jgi:PRTRC genetic system ThiF family protein
MEQNYRVVLPAAEQLAVVLVGVGGTGSHLAGALARLAYHLRGKSITVQMLFVDHDAIEEKNIGRQYHPGDIGYWKAEIAAFRVNMAYGLQVMAAPVAFTAERFGEWTAGCDRRAGANLIISAVDNHLARAEIAGVVQERAGRWYCLDLGNEQHSGQVLLGNATDIDAIKFDRLGLCSGLPSPYVQEPTLLEPPPAEAAPFSCAELTLREEQSLVVNQQVAALAAHYAYQFLVRRELTQMATHFTLEPPTTKSRRVTEANVCTLQHVKSSATKERHKSGAEP